MKRRDFLRAGLLAAGGLSLSGVLAACSKKSASPASLANASTLREIFDARAKEGGKQAVDVFLAGEDWVAGVENHLTFGVVRKGGGPDAPIKDENATLWLAPSPDLSGKPVGPFTASWRGYSKPETGGPPGSTRPTSPSTAKVSGAHSSTFSRREALRCSASARSR